jgi:hypothetical protein
MFTRDDPAPRERRAVSYAWPNLILLPALMGGLHATTYTLLFHLFLGEAFGFSGGRPAPWPGAIVLIWLASFWTTRAISRLSLTGRTAQVASLGCWLATLLLWFASEPVYREARLWTDPGSLVQGNAYLVPPMLISMITWWQGIRYAMDQSSITAEETRGTVQRSWMVIGGSILLALFVGGENGENAMRAARIAVPLLLILSLALVAGAELETTRRLAVRRGGQPPGWGRWFRLVSGLSTIVVVITIIVLALLGPEVLGAVVGFMFAAARLIGMALGYILYAVFFTLFQVITGFVWLLEELFGDVFGPIDAPQAPPINPPMMLDQVFPEQEPTEQWEYAILLRWVVLGLMLIALAIVLFRITRRSSLPNDEGIVEEHRESVFSADLARKQLRDLFRRRQHGERRRPLDLNGNPADVRDVMRYLETLALRQNAGRKEAETSSDFLERLRAVWPGLGSPLIDLTGRYQRIRYGEYPDSPESPEYGPAVRDWTQIWNRRKDVVIEPPADDEEKNTGRDTRR